MGERLLSKRDAAVGLVVAAGFAAHFLGAVDWPWWVDWPVCVWFYTVWGFFALVHARNVVRLGEEGSWWATQLAPLLVLFIPADALFNLLYGSYIFREAPHWPEEWLFSSRVERHYRNLERLSSDDQRAAAALWHGRLRAVDPIGHNYDD